MGGEDEESFGVFRLCNKLDMMGDRKSTDRLIQITSQPLKGIDEFLLLFFDILTPELVFFIDEPHLYQGDQEQSNRYNN